MRTKRLITGALVGILAGMGSSSNDGFAAAQAPAASASRTQKAASALPRTPWGHPDLQGIWSNFDRTPFERPLPVKPAPKPTPPAARGVGVGPAAEFHSDWDHTKVSAVRPSVVVDPPTGRVPVRPEAEARRDYDRAHIADHWEHNSPWERCITRGVPGGMFPSEYNNAYQIVQTPDHVVILQEMIHDARVIPIDGRAHLDPAIRQWMGDSRGRWEGDTLVVETTNFTDKGWITNNGATGRIKGIPHTANLRVVERFTRVDANTINWEARIEDPQIYTSPWTVMMPLNLEGPYYQIFEYACHEGNYAIPNTLSGGRAEDAEAAKKR
jgi:hypothetical protein